MIDAFTEESVGLHIEKTCFKGEHVYWMLCLELGEYLCSVTDPKTSFERVLNTPELTRVFVPNPYFDVRERLVQYLSQV
ncbi:hypothetical protein [Microbulbifer sp. TYP-18]|uniref:hypothetical protein n=1 Tax=Microbulbifer sp. TYP-18 TaxID=3230024 RepID=UPI0034C66A60